MIIKDIFVKLSRETDRKIIVFQYSEKAWQWITSVAVAKPRFVMLKTARNGPTVGLIPVEQGVSIPKECSTTMRDKNMVLTYDGSVVTSDLDIFSIERKENEEVTYDEYFGYLTLAEKKIIEDVNLLFQRATGRKTNLVTHGPYVNLSKPKQADIVCPYDAFHPASGHIILNDISSLINFNPELKKIKNWSI